MDLLTGKFATDFGYVFEFEYGDMSRCLLYCNTKQFINSMQRFLPDLYAGKITSDGISSFPPSPGAMLSLLRGIHIPILGFGEEGPKRRP
jgi:hypothetical protein